MITLNRSQAAMAKWARKFIAQAPAVAVSSVFLMCASHAAAENLLDWITGGASDAMTAIKEGRSTQQVRVHNAIPRERKFYWTASGCAGISDGVTFVCHSEKLGVNGFGAYTFKKGTSGRHIHVKDINWNEKKDGKAGKCQPEKYDVNSRYTMAIWGALIGVTCSTYELEYDTFAVSASYTLQIRSSVNEPTRFYFVAFGCTLNVDGMSSICQTVDLAPNSTASIKVTEDQYSGRAGVIFKGLTSNKRAEERLVSRNYVEIQPDFKIGLR